MEMLHVTSGKVNYDLFSSWDYYSTESPISRDLLVKMLMREDQLRKAPETQAKYSESDDWDHLRSVTLAIQRQVLSEFGMEGDDALVGFHSMRAKYEKDKVIKDLAVYIKYDKSNKGNLSKGSKVPNGSEITLFDLQGCKTTLASFIGTKPLVILAGSYT